jgi:nitrogen fixation NifU-like protein
MSLYKEILLDHYKKPCHYDTGQILQPSFVVSESNPLCGDVVQIKGVIANDKLAQVCFSGSGCVISQATASMLLAKYADCKLVDIVAISPQDILALIQLDLGPNRIKCALLALIALQAGIINATDLLLKKTE